MLADVCSLYRSVCTHTKILFAVFLEGSSHYKFTALKKFGEQEFQYILLGLIQDFSCMCAHFVKSLRTKVLVKDSYIFFHLLIMVDISIFFDNSVG